MKKNPSKNLFNRNIMRLQARKFSYAQIAPFIRPVIDEMLFRLSLIKRTFENGLFIGHYGETQNQFEPHIKNLLFTDIVHLKEASSPKPVLLLDEENLPFREKSFDCVINCLTLHSVNNIPRALHEIKRILKPDGIFLSVLPCGDSFHQLRHTLISAESDIIGGAYTRIPPFATLYDLSVLLQKIGFALPVIDRDKIIVEHKSIYTFIKDIYLWGWMSAYPQTLPIRRDVLRHVKKIYQNQFANEKGIVSTECELAWLSGWAPHISQPKALKPGTAQTSLADILHVPKKLR